MTKPSNSSAFRDMAVAVDAAFDWWREAGVDSDYVTEPRSWLAEITPSEGVREKPPKAGFANKPRAEAPPPASIIARDELPSTLLEFQAWWMKAPSFNLVPTRPRIPPRGDLKPKVAILVAMPEEVDQDALLSGEQGGLLRNILRAMSFPEASAYVASVLPQYDVVPDWAQLAERGLGDIVCHHMELTGADRIVVFGRPASTMLRGGEDGRGPWHFERGGRVVHVLPAPSLEAMLHSPQRKRRFWHDWLRWTGEQK